MTTHAMRDRVADETFDAFCLRAYPNLVAALTHRCGDAFLAEEFAQDALVTACRRWPDVSRLQSPEGWCYRVGANAAASWFRRRKAEQRAHERARGAAVSIAASDPTDELAVRAALATLTPPLRDAVILRYFLDLSVEETAEALGASPAAIRTRTHRAVSALRGVLDVSDDAIEARHGA